MPRARTSIVEQLSSVFLGSTRARVLSGGFAVVIGLLVGYLWFSGQRIERLADPVGLGRAGEPSVDDVAPATAPEVLVLDSYHRGYSWSDNEVDGISSALGAGTPRARMALEYLDCKRFPRMEHFDRVRDVLAAKYGAHPPSVVIAADNPALVFALRYRSHLFPGVPIVFCGINGFESAMLAGQPNVTGIAEVLDGATTVRAALRLQPDVRKVVVVHDYTITGLASRHEVEPELAGMDGVEIQYLEDLPLDALLSRIEALPADSIVLALSYSLDAEGRVVNHEQIANLLSTRSHVPVYGAHQERLGFGIIGGSLTGGRLQGERAAQFAQRILAGEPASSIPVDLRSPTRLMFDYPQLERFHIPVKALPPGAVVVNRPVSLLATYSGLFASATAIMVVLSAGIILLGLNVYRRQQAETALSESERNFKTLFESAADIIFIEDPQGRLLDANEEAIQSLGYEKAALLRLSVRQIIAPQHHEALSRSRQTAAEGQRAVLECELMARDGTTLPAELHSRGIDLSGGQAVLTIARDLSERKKAEADRDRLYAQFVQAQKMESIGRLAGGVAHDFNNILTSIFGYSQLLLNATPPGDARRSHVQVIQHAAESAAALTRQLLLLSRKQVLESHPVLLNDVVDRVQSMLARVLGDQFHIDFRPGQLVPVLADPGQLEQVVMNLVVNARDAMKDGGTITIETGLGRPADSHGDPGEDASNGSHVVLTVTDTGVGMSAEIQQKIFEPFFSTKDPSKGTGLGLATVYGIVRQHGGEIVVDSEVGHGTAIRIYLPAAPDTQAVAARTPTSHAPVHGGPETVLVVDDDESIVSMLTETLSAVGYHVLSTSSPQEAIALVRERKSPLHLLVTDVVMREMNGRELAVAVRELVPDIELVFISGYTDDMLAKQELTELGATFLEKPFAPSDLAKAVRAKLDGPREAT